MLKIFGFVLFAFMVVIHIFCFAGQRHYPPMSVVVAVLGFTGMVLMQIGYRMEKNNASIKKTLYPHRISNQAPDDFGFDDDGRSEDSSSNEIESFAPEPLDPETEIEISKLPTPK